MLGPEKGLPPSGAKVFQLQEMTAMVSTSTSTFQWNDPFLLADQLTKDEPTLAGKVGCLRSG
jgi:hypothetical protein